MNKIRQRGFSLVELMVGIVIALLALLVIAGVLVVYSQQQKTTVSANEAQNTGMVAAYLIERELRMAGYGLTTPAALGCTVHFKNGKVVAEPVRITRDNVTGSDQISVFYATDSRAPLAARVTETTTNTFSLNKEHGIFLNPGDVVLFTPDIGNDTSPAAGNCDGISGRDCVLGQSTRTSEVGSSFQTQLGSSYEKNGKTYESPYNSGNGKLNICTSPASNIPITGGDVIPFGDPAHYIFAVTPQQQLTRQSTVPTDTGQEVIAEGVVALRAQYILDTDGDGQSDQFVDPWDTQPSNWNWTHVVGIRFALVSRNDRRDPEKTMANGSLELWPGTTLANGTEIPTQNLALTEEQQHYRYRVYQTIVPLRNYIWNPAKS